MVLRNVKAPDDWSRIYDIEFQYVTGQRTKKCQNIFSYDIETSNGWRQPDGTVLGFDHDLYNSDEEYRNKIDNGEPVSLMYIWQIGIETQYGPMVFVGRTWEDYGKFIDMLTKEVRRQAFFGQKCINRGRETAAANRSRTGVSMEIYIHHMAFEFEHLRNIWEKDFANPHSKRGGVFAREARKPMKFSVHFNKVRVEHRDSLVLTQKSLSAWCSDEKLPVQKLKEPDDYYLELRTPETPLTDEEIQYSINDVVSMLYGIEKYRKKYAELKDIPLTQTGIVRARCRETICMGNPEWAQLCTDVTHAYTPDMFKKLCHLFQGGWTHANKMYVGRKLKNIKCFDFASSYPAVMCTRRFPITSFEERPLSDWNMLESQDVHSSDYRWFAKIKVNNIKSKLWSSYWSTSKVCVTDNHVEIENVIADNGRIYSCDTATMYMTDLDWDTFKQCYTFSDYEVQELYSSIADYLPYEAITTILEYFQYKTTLKGDEANESLYNESKQFINGIYGCSVQKIVAKIVSFGNNGWESREPNDDDILGAVNEASPDKTFLSYQIGVWVTSWARHNLFDFIIPLDHRVVYCDTDSIKGLFTDDDIKFVEDYNKKIAQLEDDVADAVGFDRNLFTAKTSKGKIKRLGVMEREDDCDEFKTLGAKRYVYLADGKIHSTIAGLPKSAGAAKLKSVDDFNDHTVWNTRESKKLIARYNDNQSPCVWTDRNGKTYKSEDKFGICLQPTTFDMSMGEEFRHFIQLLINGDIDNSDEFFNDTPKILI